MQSLPTLFLTPSSQILSSELLYLYLPGQVISYPTVIRSVYGVTGSRGTPTGNEYQIETKQSVIIFPLGQRGGDWDKHRTNGFCSTPLACAVAQRRG